MPLAIIIQFVPSDCKIDQSQPPEVLIISFCGVAVPGKMTLLEALSE